MAQNNPQAAGKNAPAISLRPERPDDEPLLAQVYASTREAELNLTNWDAPTRAAFLDMQFKAMLRGYRADFPQGEFSIILSDGKPVGRMVVNRAANEIRVVDIALLPIHCGHGIGTKLMRDIMDEAARAKKPVRLCVFRGTRATPFYLRLGFRIIGEPDVYEQMEWKAS